MGIFQQVLEFRVRFANTKKLMDNSNKHRINGGVAETVEEGAWEARLVQEVFELASQSR